MTYNEQTEDEQAIEIALQRARLALQLAMSHERPVTVSLKYEHGEITFGVKLDAVS